MNKTKPGLVHLYWGEGKGKTTAAMGLAVRAIGRGLRVVIVQFLKNGDSGELTPLRQLGARIYSQEGVKFVSQMTPEEKAETKAAQNENLQKALEESCDLLILDEACVVCQLQMVDEKLLKKAVLNRPSGQEIVLTGRDPAPWMQSAADYSTEMCRHAHPYEKGISARRGIEY